MCLIPAGIAEAGSVAKPIKIADKIDRSESLLTPPRWDKANPPAIPGDIPVKINLRSPSTNSPGNIIGETYMEWQVDGTQGRRIAHGYPQNQYTHIVWIYNKYPLEWDPESGIYYQVYNNGIYDYDAGGIDIGQHIYELTTSLAILPDNRAVSGQQYVIALDPLSAGVCVNIEITPNFGVFNVNELNPDPAADWYVPECEVIYPSVETHIGTDTVVYTLNVYGIPGTNDGHGMLIYRKVGSSGFDNGTWLPANWGWFHIIVARQSTDSVAMVYLDRGWEGGGESADHFNVVYRLSTDQGITWGPVVNVSNYLYPDSLWSVGNNKDVSALWDSNGDLHIVWQASERDIESGLWWKYRTRLLHWSTADQITGIVAEARYSADCYSNEEDRNAGKASISQCENKLYVSWVQYNDYDVSDDCSDSGFANGEIYMAASDDNGLTWDTAVNLTNTRTPDCAAGDCESDIYPSMTRYGAEYAGARDSLDLVYINDKHAGVAWAGMGEWTNNYVIHYRIPCRDVVHIPKISLNPDEYGYPMMMAPNQMLDTELTIINLGNGLLNWDASINYISCFDQLYIRRGIRLVDGNAVFRRRGYIAKQHRYCHPGLQLCRSPRRSVDLGSGDYYLRNRLSRSHRSGHSAYHSDCRFRQHSAQNRYSGNRLSIFDCLQYRANRRRQSRL